jgi:hypothetical protein
MTLVMGCYYRNRGENVILSSEAIDHATLELLAAWRREDATQNPEELRAAEQELAEFKRTMNENRASSGQPLYL